MLLSWNKVICCKLLALVLKWPACSLSWSTDWRLKERFLIRRNRTKCANFWCNHLLQATYNTTKNSLTNLSLSVRCQEAGRRKRARDCLNRRVQRAEDRATEFCRAIERMTVSNLPSGNQPTKRPSNNNITNARPDVKEPGKVYSIS